MGKIFSLIRVPGSFTHQFMDSCLLILPGHCSLPTITSILSAIYLLFSML